VAKLCQVPQVKGVENNTFRPWSRILKFCAPGVGSSPVGLVKGDPGSELAFWKKGRPPLCKQTKLYSEDVGSITRFDKHDLVLVGVVEWPTVIHSNGEVEGSSVDL